MLGILDYEAGNQTSVRSALEHLGIPCVISAQKQTLTDTDGIIFPGVGQAGQAMHKLKELGLDSLLKEFAQNGKPILGICLGCQILLEYSEEGDTPLLGLLKGSVKRFAKNLRLEDGSKGPVPHMGWNTLSLCRDCRLFDQIPADAAFYFVHSYYTLPDPNLVCATTDYGHPFCSVLGRDGLWGVQFHPEKSGRPGLSLLKNFADYCSEVQHAE